MPSRPNILLIYSDQHRYDCVRANGHPLVRTPSMDRLAREGMRFTQAYTPIPMCVPARVSFLTSQWAMQHQVLFNFDAEAFKPLPVDPPTTVKSVQRAGYHTIHIGRWHVDPKRTPLDFGAHDYVPDWRYAKWRAARGLGPRTATDGALSCADVATPADKSPLYWSATQVIDWLDRARQDDDPFLIRWQMTEPHPHYRPSEPYASMYDPAQIAPWPGFADEFANKPYFQRQMRATWGLEGKTWDDWAPVVAHCLGVISELDANIGRVLDALDARGLAENTLVVYSTDHGDMCGSHGMVDKHGIMYDDVVRVPMIARLPGVVRAGSTCDAFVSNVIDLGATFCDLAGAEPPPGAMGLGLRGLFEDPAATWPREDIYSTYHGNQFGGYSQRMVRDHRWKYIWNATAEDELYDLESDPGELVNLATEGTHGAELSRLRGRLVSWMEQTDDGLLNHWTRAQLLKGRKLSDRG